MDPRLAAGATYGSCDRQTKGPRAEKCRGDKLLRRTEQLHGVGTDFMAHQDLP
ncbi:hypothetical protein ACP70R_037678 [Stipagrostis hirtigluma subsp. patula]